MRRRALDHSLTVVTGACAACAVGVLLFLISVMVIRGGSALSWNFLSGEMQSVGASGGILYNIAGTLILIATALVISLPLATGVALVQAVYLPPGPARHRMAFLLAIVHGLPSILFGLFGLMFFVKALGWGKSWLTGGIILGLMMIPTIALALVARIESLPRRYLETASALGLNSSQVIWSVLLPQCASGWITGSMLGLARVAGETAPIMFTATVFAGATLPQGIRESPVLSLPYHIFVLSQDSLDPATAPRIWATALVLLGLVFAFSLAVLPARFRLQQEARHG